MDSKEKNMKKCGAEFSIRNGELPGQSIKVRRNIPKDKLTTLDR